MANYYLKFDYLLISAFLLLPCFPLVSQAGNIFSTCTTEDMEPDNDNTDQQTLADVGEKQHEDVQPDANSNTNNNNNDQKVDAQFPNLPDDIMVKILSNLDPTSLNCVRQVNYHFRRVANMEAVKEAVAHGAWSAWSGWLKEHFPFVKIPAGNLPAPNGPNGPGGVGRRVEPFETSRYPVTREFWEKVMGSVPISIPRKARAKWSECPKCPMTYVAWEDWDKQNRRSIPAEIQEFIQRLNRMERKYSKDSKSYCTYDLPTDDQLWYSIRGDVTGTNTDPYSAGVTDQNVNDYVTHWENSDQQIQRVGRKAANRFEVELGNVWKMSKALYDSEHPKWGRSVRGGGWRSCVSLAGSGICIPADSGYRCVSVGFSLVRTCH